MNKPNEPVNPVIEPSADKKRPDMRIVEKLFNATTLGAAVVASAIIGPKVPPLLGE